MSAGPLSPEFSPLGSELAAHYSFNCSNSPILPSFDDPEGLANFPEPVDERLSSLCSTPPLPQSPAPPQECQAVGLQQEPPPESLAGHTEDHAAAACTEEDAEEQMESQPHTTEGSQDPASPIAAAEDLGSEGVAEQHLRQCGADAQLDIKANPGPEMSRIESAESAVLQDALVSGKEADAPSSKTDESASNEAAAPLSKAYESAGNETAAFSSKADESAGNESPEAAQLIQGPSSTPEQTEDVKPQDASPCNAATKEMGNAVYSGVTNSSRPQGQLQQNAPPSGLTQRQACNEQFAIGNARGMLQSSSY